MTSPPPEQMSLTALSACKGGLRYLSEFLLFLYCIGEGLTGCALYRVIVIHARLHPHSESDCNLLPGTGAAGADEPTPVQANRPDKVLVARLGDGRRVSRPRLGHR
jgi:hypothetical protein